MYSQESRSPRQLNDLLGIHAFNLKTAAHIQVKVSHHRSRELSWVTSGNMSAGVSSHLAILTTQSQQGRLGMQARSCLRTCSPGHVLRSLCEQAQLDQALDYLLRINPHLVPPLHIYISLLKACTKKKAMSQAKQIHAHLALHGLDATRVLGENLVNSLAKCGSVQDAVEVFHRLPHRSAFSWTAVITGYTESGQARGALQMYQRMGEEGVQPNGYTFVSLLKACGNIADLEEGKRIHAEILKHGWETDLFVSTGLVDMYGKCGSMSDAQDVFDRLSQRDVVSWNVMLAARIQQGDAEGTLKLYDEMREQGLSPSSRTFVSVLQACGMLSQNRADAMVDGETSKMKALDKGRSIHAHIQRNGCETDIFVGCTLVSMYGKCGSIADAEKVFDRLPQRNVVSWNAMLAAYVEQGKGAKAVQLYGHMQEEAVSPDAWTYVSTLQACCMVVDKECIRQSVKLNCLAVGESVHADARRSGSDADAFVGNALISMYGKCGSILQAERVFHGLSHRDVVSWNAMLAAYVEQGQEEKALLLYRRMQEEGVSPDGRTFVSLVQACGRLGEKEENVTVDRQSPKVRSLGKGRAIHTDICRKGYDLDVFVGNTLVSMYGKCGSIADAERVFDGLSQRNVVAWTAMLAAYVEQGQGGKALELYMQMQQEGPSPDEITSLWALQACSNTGNLSMLKQLHHTIVSAGNNVSPAVATALISAYGRCGSMVDGQAVFHALPQADVVSWNALIAGYARQGNYAESLQCYEEMQLEGVKPDGVTFLSLLCVCGHAGLVVKGVEYFESMSRDHGIGAEIGHYVSMVDLFGRAGCFKRIENLLSTMPVQPDLALWLCLLGACRKHGNIILAEQAFDSAVCLDPTHAAAYILMSHIYVDAGLLTLAKKVEKLRQECSQWKKPGQSYEQELHTPPPWAIER